MSSILAVGSGEARRTVRTSRGRSSVGRPVHRPVVRDLRGPARPMSLPASARSVAACPPGAGSRALPAAVGRRMVAGVGLAVASAAAVVGLGLLADASAAPSPAPQPAAVVGP